MKLSIKPTVNQSVSEHFSFKPLLSCPYSLLSHLSQERKKSGIICSAPLFFAVGRYFISPWNFHFYFTHKMQPKAKPHNPEAIPNEYEIALNSHLPIWYNCPMPEHYPSRDHWGFLQNASTTAAFTEQEAKAAFIEIHPDTLNA